MNLAAQISELVQAAVGDLYVQTIEPDAVLAELAQMCRHEGWRLVVWDFHRGLSSNGFDIDAVLVPTVAAPIEVLKAIPKLGSQPGTTLLALRGFHRFLERPDVALTLERQLTAARGLRLTLVILAPVLTRSCVARFRRESCGLTLVRENNIRDLHPIEIECFHERPPEGSDRRIGTVSFREPAETFG